MKKNKWKLIFIPLENILRFIARLFRVSRTRDLIPRISFLMGLFIGAVIFSFSFDAQAALLKVVDFDNAREGESPDSMSCWTGNENDADCGCSMTFDNRVKRGKKGASLRLDYDVSSPNPAYCGFRLKLKEKDLSEYAGIVFWIKGDAAKGYSRRIKFELKNAQGQSDLSLVTRITDKWKQVAVYFDEFKNINDYSNMDEFRIIFDDVVTLPQEGAVYIDDIAFFDGNTAD
ncbi:MAG: carbohydrate binding domain-containing protein [Candidatus Omnitrophota bacterium]